MLFPSVIFDPFIFQSYAVGGLACNDSVELPFSNQQINSSTNQRYFHNKG